jgi:hypothetical protein
VDGRKDRGGNEGSRWASSGGFEPIRRPEPRGLRRTQTCGPSPAAGRAYDRDVLQLFVAFDAPQEKGATAHVTATDEFRRKQQSVAKDRKQAVDILSGGNASKQDHIAGGVGKSFSGASQWPRESSFFSCNRYGDKLAQLSNSDAGFGRKQSPARRDNLHSSDSGGGARKVLSIRQLSPKVQPAAEGEDLGQFRVSNLGLSREFESSLGAGQELSATTPGTGGGKDKHSFHWRKRDGQKILP